VCVPQTKNPGKLARACGALHKVQEVACLPWLDA